MAELTDNIFQLAVVAFCAIFAWITYLRKKSTENLLILLFFATFGLGSLYWCIYLPLCTVSPLHFPIADMSWIAAYIFLVIFQQYIASPGEKAFHTPFAWIVPIAGLGLTFYYFYWSNYITEFLWYAVFSVLGYLSVRGLLWTHRQKEEARNPYFFHLNVLFILLIEHMLWIFSCCFYITDSFLNPYYLIDLMLTLSFPALLYTMRKAVCS